MCCKILDDYYYYFGLESKKDIVGVVEKFEWDIYGFWECDIIFNVLKWMIVVGYVIECFFLGEMYISIFSSCYLFLKDLEKILFVCI